MKLIPGAQVSSSKGIRLIDQNKSNLGNLIEQDRINKENQKRLEQAQKEQQAINDFNNRQQEIQNGNIFTKAKAFIKEQTGHGDVLPVIDGASKEYSSQQQAMEMNRQYKAEVLGRTSLALGADTLLKKGSDFVTNTKNEINKSINERGVSGTSKELAIGAGKNLGEMLSGGVNLGSKVATNFLLPGSNYANLRKIIDYSTGKPVEQVLDRNTPDYQKKVNAFIDENGIFNYHPSYANEIQKTGGDIAEIGSWFIPITRVGRVAEAESKLAGLIKEIPKVAEILSVHPSSVKLVKTGSKFAYEVSKDIVDVTTLDAIRGKNWDTIKEDATYAGIGGGVIRGVGAGAEALSKSGLVSSMAEKLQIGRENKIKNSIEQTIGKLSSDESSIVSQAIQEGRPVDDISTEIMTKRANAGEDIIKAFEKPPVSDTQTNLESIIAKDGQPSATDIKPLEQNKPIQELPKVESPNTQQTIGNNVVETKPVPTINKPKVQPFEGTGKVKERGAGSTLNTKLSNEGISTLKELPEYRSVNFDEMQKYGAEMLKSNKEDLLSISKREMHDGKITPEVALLSIINSGDKELIARAMNEDNVNSILQEATSMGQRNASWMLFSPDSAMHVLGDISATRIKKAGKEKIAKTMKSLEKEVKNIKPKLKIEKAQQLLDELMCK